MRDEGRRAFHRFSSLVPHPSSLPSLPPLGPLADAVAREAPHDDPFAQLADDLVDQIANGLLVRTDVRLIEEAVRLVIFLDAAGHDLIERLLRLALVDCRLAIDLLLSLDDLRRHLRAI